MANEPTVSVILPGTITVRVHDENVLIAFVTDGEPVPLTKKHGEVVPVGEDAQFYVFMKDGRPARVVSRKELIDELAVGFGNGVVFWQPPVS